MRNEDNPYRPPDARIASEPWMDEAHEPTCWRHGQGVLVLHDRPLPPRCIKCNADADGMRVYRFIWVTSKVYAPLLLVPLAVLLMAIVRSVWVLLLVPLAFLLSFIASRRLRRHSRHAVGLCAQHRRIQQRVLGCAFVVVLAAMVSPWSFVWPLAGPALPLTLFGLAIVIAASSSGRTLVPVWMDAHYSCFGNCGDAFLQSLPEWPEVSQHGQSQ